MSAKYVNIAAVIQVLAIPTVMEKALTRVKIPRTVDNVEEYVVSVKYAAMELVLQVQERLTVMEHQSTSLRTLQIVINAEGNAISAKYAAVERVSQVQEQLTVMEKKPIPKTILITVNSVDYYVKAHPFAL